MMNNGVMDGLVYGSMVAWKRLENFDIPKFKRRNEGTVPDLFMARRQLV